MKINAILLAAGLSSRMKGPNKLLLPFEGTNVISCTYKALKGSQLSSVVVVSGRDSNQVRKSLNLRDQDRVIHNVNYEKGMTSSIQTGLDRLEDSDAVMIALGDMPWLKTEDYDQLIGYFQGNGGKNKILVPWHDQKRGNPVIFGSAFFEAILNHQEPNGCAKIVKENPDSVLNLSVERKRFTMDIDTLEDLERSE